MQEPASFPDCDPCPEMVVVPGGTFQMGSPKSEKGRFDDEGLQREVTIRPFAIGKYEVTFEEWDACVAAGGCNGYRPDDAGWGRGRRPVINVSWHDAQAYLAWLAEATDEPYRLPSEAEWEYAARAGTTTRYAFGDEITEKDANYYWDSYWDSMEARRVSSISKTTEVGTYRPNLWGLYDMHGNVWEWVEDVWRDNYEGAPTDGSARTGTHGTKTDSYRVIRGGSYGVTPRLLRSATRGRSVPDDRYYIQGFRVARTLD